jgi:hypothetical protein
MYNTKHKLAYFLSLLTGLALMGLFMAPVALAAPATGTCPDGYVYALPISDVGRQQVCSQHLPAMPTADPVGASCNDGYTSFAILPAAGSVPATDPAAMCTDHGGVRATTNFTSSSNKCGGNGNDSVNTTINLGCKGTGNPINDLLFAVIRFMITGVGIVIVAVVIVAGLQYSTAQGEPQKQAAARMRIVNALLALLLYLFTFAILQWLVPGGVFI